MLNYAGIETSPVLLSTISNGIPIYPTITGLDYVIAKTEIKGNTVLLDATEQNSHLNLLPTRTMNWYGIEMTENNYKKINLSPKKKSRINYNIMAQLDENAILSGQCRAFYSDQFALNARNSLLNKADNDIVQMLENKYSLNHINQHSLKNLKELNMPLVQSFSFDKTDNFVELVGNRYYLSPLMFLASKDHPFKQEERFYPVDFTHPENRTYRIQISLPPNFEVEYLPERNFIKMDNDMLSFSYVIEEQNGNLILDVKKEIDVTVILPEDYSYLKQYYDTMLEKELEKVVLIKKS